MTDRTYNGWHNYETWCVNLWLSNDEPLYTEALERTRAALADAEPEGRRVEVADTLQAWVRYDVIVPLGATLEADLLGAALAEVDWYEIADAWIAQVDDEDEGA